MSYVYLLKSKSHPRKQYVGSTRDLRQRLKAHNESRSPHTAKFRPWLLIAYFAFAEEKTAIAFERYLKSGSGRAFINRHFCVGSYLCICGAEQPKGIGSKRMKIFSKRMLTGSS